MNSIFQAVGSMMRSRSRGGSPAASAASSEQKQDSDDDGKNKMDEETTSSTSNNKKSPNNNDTKQQGNNNSKKKDPKLSKTPLTVCPDCDKVFATMRSLFGHYGVKHRCSIVQDDIRYACPFCSDASDAEELFDSLDELESHVTESHPECSLLADSGVYATTPTSNKKKSGVSSKKKEKLQPQPSSQSSTLPSSSSSSEQKRRSTRTQELEDTKETTTETSSDIISKPAKKQQYSHPICKCPNCEKMFPPTGLFGHFGRVHSGQLGQTFRFEWKNVSFACPYCPPDDGETKIFRTIELIEAHVSSHHPNCHLTRPNSMSNSSPKRKLETAKKKPDIGSSSAGVSRKSQRSSSRRSSIDDEGGRGGDDDDAMGMRKSQRSRRPVVDNNVMFSSGGEGNAAIRSGAAKQKTTYAEEEEVKPLYSCPACDKTNLTKHGLHAHYGMKHGGSVDMATVKMCRPVPKKKQKKVAVSSRTGPWTNEEHEAFMEGCRVYGNRWKQISLEYVPTRDAKQIGSHALNYFTSKGEWHKIGGKPGYQSSSRQGSTLMDEGGYDDEGGDDVMSMDVGSDGGDEKEDAASDGDDGNSSHCIVCFEGGNIVCCSKCPRAYHPKCLAKDGQAYGGGVNIELMPDDWQCNRCKRDIEITTGEEIPDYAFGNKKIRAAYAEFKDCSDYNYCCSLLSNILDILKKLQEYDYGYVFSEPVDIEDVPDYLTVVQTPMDYGTVSERLENGKYVDLIGSDDVSREDENSTMEDILLHVLCDIQRVHHNCHLYNKKASSIFRIADVHASKWNAYFNHYILERLPENVHRDLTLFDRSCKLELNERDHSMRYTSVKNESKSSAKKAPSAESLPSSPPINNRKRKASEELEDYYEEEEECEEDDDEDDDEDEDEGLTKKTKGENISQAAGYSTALLFTEDQMRSLENVFFSSATKLGKEIDEFDACSALTSSPQGGSPGTSPMSIANDDSGKSDGPNIEGLKSDADPSNRPPHPTEASSTPGDAVASSLPEGSISPGAPPASYQEPSASPKTSDFAPPQINDGDDTKNIVNMDKVVSNDNTPNPNASTQHPGTTFNQRQWYERLDELKKYKVTHGTAVVSATSNDKLYHWRSRQRKRYHLTLFRMPHLKRKMDDDPDFLGESNGNKNDEQWLLTMPEMKGVFALPNVPDGEDKDAEKEPTPFIINEKDVESDKETAIAICNNHQQQLYYPLELYPHRTSLSLFWDECLEELRFFQGEHGHTLVPRDFPYNSCLPVWVELQRAKYLLQKIGVYSGLTGAQILVLDELDLCDLSSIPIADKLLKTDDNSSTQIGLKTPLASGNIGKKSGMIKSSGKGSSLKSSPSKKKSWSTRVSEFKEWYDSLSPEDKPNASALLPRLNWPLYSWCWRQCNASSAVLRETPNIQGMKTMSLKKLDTLSSVGFFHAFPYNGRNNGLVCEDDYEGSDAFVSTFQILEDFSIKYSDTVLPGWYECDEAFRMWVSALENGLSSFARGEPCVLTAQQIEKLILIGFCNDRNGLPDLSRRDVVWLKMFAELKRHQVLFGVCHVSSDFPRLHQWVAEQKELFLLARSGTKSVMSPSRLKMLMDAGVDFFTGECLPTGVLPLLARKMPMATNESVLTDPKQFQRLTLSPVDTFPPANSIGGSDATNAETNHRLNDNYWNHQDCLARFEQFKVETGRSLILANEDIEVYRWFVEKRGNDLLSEINSNYFSDKGGYESNGLYSQSILRYITTQKQDTEDDGMGLNGMETIETVDQSMFLWLHYYERLMIFKARKGHCKIPKDYPDIPLVHWLSQQQDFIHLYSINQPVPLKPVQMKLLHALGVHGCKRDVAPPKLSTRVLKRKRPSRKKEKRQRVIG